MSFMLTKRGMYNRTKTVTRRYGWAFLKPGDLLLAVEQSQGLKKGEKAKPIGVIRVLDTRWEPLDRMLTDLRYGVFECQREDFPELTPAQFVRFLSQKSGHDPSEKVNRILFEHVDEEAGP